MTVILFGVLLSLAALMVVAGAILKHYRLISK